uniref:Uncharacterized protein n=1 Tax=Anguilla anguilla TaxID=7936 RepID=A0A0E9QGN6_ANGAN
MTENGRQGDNASGNVFTSSYISCFHCTI